MRPHLLPHGWPVGGNGHETLFVDPRWGLLGTSARGRGRDDVTDTDQVAMPTDRPPMENVDTAIGLVARTLYGEGRWGPRELRLAVAEVIYNRAMKRSPRFGMSVEAVCRRPEQFSCWNPGNPGRNGILSLPLTDPDIADCVSIARDLVAGQVSALTHGACHYHHRRIFPVYSREHTPCARIGNYLFFNDIP